MVSSNSKSLLMTHGWVLCLQTCDLLPAHQVVMIITVVMTVTIIIEKLSSS